MRSKLIGGAALVLSCGLVGAAAAQPAPMDPSQGQDQELPQEVPQATPMDQGAQPTTDCPEFVKGAKLTVANVDKGVELTITTTTKANIPELRKMLHVAADTIAQGSEDQLAPGGASETDSATPPDKLPPVDVAVKDIANGARVTVKAKQSSDVAQIRELAGDLDSFWKSSTCVNSKPTMGTTGKAPVAPVDRTPTPRTPPTPIR